MIVEFFCSLGFAEAFVKIFEFLLALLCLRLFNLLLNAPFSLIQWGLLINFWVTWILSNNLAVGVLRRSHPAISTIWIWFCRSSIFYLIVESLHLPISILLPGLHWNYYFWLRFDLCKQMYSSKSSLANSLIHTSRMDTVTWNVHLEYLKTREQWKWICEARETRSK